MATDPFVEAKAALECVDRFLTRSCPGKARDAIARAEAKLGALDEGVASELRHELLCQFELVQQVLDGRQPNSVVSAIDRVLFLAEEVLEEDAAALVGVSLGELVEQASDMLADDENRKLLDPEALAKYGVRIAKLESRL
jgi:hypothetical protein